MPELLPFQQRGVEKVINVGHGRMLLWVPMGRGKTPMAAKISCLLSCRRIVVVCKDSGVPVWTRKTTDPERLLGRDWLEHFSKMPVIVHNMGKMTPAEREYYWNILTPKDEIHVWVCVYNTFALDNGVEARTVKKKKKKQGVPFKNLKNVFSIHAKWDLVIADECKRISNKDSAAAQSVEQFLYRQQVPYFVPMSGTPGDKGPQSLFTYWRCISRRIFPSYWAYIEHFYTLMENPFGGQEIVERRKDTVDEWDRVLDKYCYYVSDAESAEGLPSLTREKIYSEMMPDQKRLFDDIREEMISIQGDEIVVAQNTLIRMLRLRQILICPKILGNFSVGGAIRTVCDILEEGTPDDRHTVIFTPFTKAFAPFTKYLVERGYMNVFHLEGGISHIQQAERIEAWRRTKGIILCSIMYAEAFSLEPATKAWFIGYEYSPDANDQAERRLLRLTTKHPVTINYLTYGTPVDERMTDIIAIKRERIDWTLPSNIRRLLHGEL